MPRHRALCSVAILCALVAAAMCPGRARAEGTTVEQHDGGAKVSIDGKLFADYLIKTGPKPIVWPIIGPGGHEMSRNYPMKLISSEKRDHPHQRSLWFTHGSINGIDFWSEVPGAGTVKHREFLKCAADGKQAAISTVNDWLAPDGKKQLEDTRTLTFRGDDKTRTIDFDITLKASDGPVKFGDTKEGTMGIRIPSAMDARQLTAATRGRIVNSNGEVDSATWGKQAPWVDYQGTLDNELMGIAMLNHPSSFRYPTYWHVRDYGLFAANPFGLHDFHGGKTSKNEGEFTLPAGETVSLRYRFVFHKGDEKAGRIAEEFEAYSKEPRP